MQAPNAQVCVFGTGARYRRARCCDKVNALVGQRPSTRLADDRHANQETACLLQRIDNLPVVIILAANLKGNLAEVFSRRFQVMIHFLLPGFKERERLWRQAFTNGIETAADRHWPRNIK